VNGPMSDKYSVDSHKLMYHVGRVNDWLGGEMIYPVYMEASPSGACNHRCTFCGLDFMEYRADFLDVDVFQDRLTELGQLGLKSIMYGGEGEPLLHKRMADIVSHAQGAGIDNAMTTNGVLLTPDLAEAMLPHTEWIKVSINAGTADTYSRIHRTKPGDFDIVVSNLTAAAELRRSKGYTCTLGMQLVLLPENRDEVKTLAAIARDAGMDYLVIKPYSQHLMSESNTYSDISYEDDLHLADELEAFNTDRYSVIFRTKTMKKWQDSEHPYQRCQALPFWSYIDSKGNVWGCSCFLGDDRFLYGNIYDNTFREIWEGDKRRRSLNWVQEKMDVAACRVNCRMDEINRYLWQLTQPPAHVNFI